MAAQHDDLSHAVWRKSIHSSQDGNCVEVAENLPGLVAVRDSKHRGGLVLTFAAHEWQSFVSGVKAGELAL